MAQVVVRVYAMRLGPPSGRIFVVCELSNWAPYWVIRDDRIALEPPDWPR